MHEEDWDFLIALSYLNYSYLDFFNEKITKRIELFLNALIETENASGDKVWELLMILSDFEPEIKFKDYKFLYHFIDDIEDEDTLKRLLDFVDKYDIEDENILTHINDLLESYLTNIVNNNDLDIDYSKYIKQNYHYHYNDYYSDYEIDMNGIEDEIKGYMDFYLDDFNVNVINKIAFDVFKVISTLDIDYKVTRYLENYEPDYDRDSYSGYYSSSSNEDDIDAIFERS